MASTENQFVIQTSLSYDQSGRQVPAFARSMLSGFGAAGTAFARSMLSGFGAAGSRLSPAETAVSRGQGFMP